MRSTEERVAAARRRAAQLARQNRSRRRRIAAASSAAAGLALSVGAALAMPGITAEISPENCSGFETSAAMLGGGTAAGYLVMALLAFSLGVCVTVLCFRLRRQDTEEEHQGDGDD